MRGTCHRNQSNVAPPRDSKPTFAPRASGGREITILFLPAGCEIGATTQGTPYPVGCRNTLIHRAILHHVACMSRVDAAHQYEVVSLDARGRPASMQSILCKSAQVSTSAVLLTLGGLMETWRQDKTFGDIVSETLETDRDNPLEGGVLVSCPVPASSIFKVRVSGSG